MAATSALRDIGSGDANTIASLLEEGTRLRDEGHAVRAVEIYRKVLALDPDNAEAARNFGLVACRLGRFDEADPFIRRTLAHEPPGSPYRAAVAQIHYSVAGTFLSRNDGASALPHLRHALAYYPSFPEARVNLTNLIEWSRRRAEPADFVPDRPLDPVGHHILVACMPKSGSSFLNAALCAVTRWPELPLSYAYMQNEQELHLPYLLSRLEYNTVTQQHCRATDPNVQILEAFGIRPVVLVRNLFDVVLSLADFYDGGAIINTFFAPRWGKLTAEHKYDLIIDHMMPWYISFFASWADVMRAGRLDCKLVTYDAMIDDKPGMLAAILAHQCLSKSAAECTAAVTAVDGAAAGTRLNKGVGGRGVAALSDAQKERIRRLASYYSDIDFSVVGL